MVITVELVSHDGIVKLDKSNYNSTFDRPIALVYDYLNVSLLLHFRDSSP